jgi:hypothetical protein
MITIPLGEYTTPQSLQGDWNGTEALESYRDQTLVNLLMLVDCDKTKKNVMQSTFDK